MADETQTINPVEMFATGLRWGEQHRQHAQLLALQKQRLQQSADQAALNAQIRRESIIANFQRAQTQAAMTKAYHDAQLGLQKNRLDVETERLKHAIAKDAAKIPQATFTRHTKELSPAEPASPGWAHNYMLGLAGKGWFAKPAKPAETEQTYTESAKAPVGTSPAAAFAAGQSPVAAAAPESLPLPPSKNALQSGKTYQTSRGPAVWDGEKFTAQ